MSANNNQSCRTCAHPQELRDRLIRAESECSELLTQVEMKEVHIKGLEVANDNLTQYYRNLTAQRDALNSEVHELRRHLGKTMSERDALQARIDAGVSVYGYKAVEDWLWCGHKRVSDTDTALLIDIKPIADHVLSTGKMVDDDRKGEA